MARVAPLLLAVLVLSAIAGIADAQDSILLDVLGGVTEKCKQNTLWFASNCSDDFAAAGEVLGFEWPPTEALSIDVKAGKQYFKGIKGVADGCCKALCDLAQSKCLCDEPTYTSITGTLFDDDGAFFLKLVQFGGQHCGHKPASMNLGKTCKKKPKNKC